MRGLTNDLGGGDWRAALGHTQEQPEGTLSWGLHFSVAPTFFDPSETAGLATPVLCLYALPDALLDPMPQKRVCLWGYPDLDELFHKQARDLNLSRREERLYQLQRLVHERVIFVPVYESAGLTGVGPRVAEPALGLITPYQWSGPYAEVRLKP